MTRSDDNRYHEITELYSIKNTPNMKKVEDYSNYLA